MSSAPSEWQTPMFRALTAPLGRVLGGATAKAFLPLGIETVHDLLRHLPARLQSGTEESDLGEIIAEQRAAEQAGRVVDDHVAVVLRVARVVRYDSNGAPRGVDTDDQDKKRFEKGRTRARLEADLTDGRGNTLKATWFGKTTYLVGWRRQLLREQRGLFVGKLSWFRTTPQLVNPDFVMVDVAGGFVGTEAKLTIARQVSKHPYLGLYRQARGLPTWKISESLDLVLDSLTGVPDPLPAWVREQAELPELRAAFLAAHQPTSREEHAQGIERIRFDEAFATQVAMAYRRADTSRHLAVPRTKRPGGLVDQLDARLPFRLTTEQTTIGAEVATDLAGARPMQRLLQGEVGSGKTVVAVRAMLTVVDSGGQAVLLAPTEVLAHQHHESISALLGELGAGRTLGAPDDATEVVLLTGSTPAPARKAALAKLASGEAGIAIGTHALLNASVEFADLGLVVVDEQHRFGVEQRNALGVRADRHPHVLVMTATPIPRSVAMTVFGDLDVSTLRELPGGRADVTTTVVDQVARPAWVDRAWARVAEEVAIGRQAYVVVPRISAESGEGASVEETYERLTSGPLAGLRLAMLHGRLPSDAKRDTMAAFAAGELEVLVATTVIEVGMDVPNATMMVVCDAERYGISQLHQLRGRIGRGSLPGVCLLLTSAEVGTDARDRLDAVAATRDGFRLAEVDLRQRREGDVLGLTQSGGRSSLRVVRVLEHADLIDQARVLAQQVVERDPVLSDPGIRDYVHQIETLAADDWSEVT